VGYLSGPRHADASPREQRLFGINSPVDLIPARPFLRSGPIVTTETAKRHSAVWACLRLRADLMSTIPVDVYRRVAGIQVECPKPPVLLAPGGPEIDWCEWVYSSQVDLDQAGNTIGIIRATDGFGLPAVVELQPITACTVHMKDNRIADYRISGVKYLPEVIWHERQFTASGLHVGLSPVAYAAYSVGEYLSILDFATDWFSGGAVPRSRLKNTAKVLDTVEAMKTKEAWKASIAAGEPFVHGTDWEYEFIQAQSASNDWIEAKKFSITDIARFFGCPADVIDGTPTGSTHTLTYANISQRNLQFLTMNLQPAITRRETKISAKMLPAPRYLKLNTDALLRLDPETRAQVIAERIRSRTLTPDEARELDNLPPLTEKQKADFDRLFGVPGTPGLGIWAPAKPDPNAPALPPGDGQPAIGPVKEPAAIEPPK